MNILVINCGSSSLKFQLIDSETEQCIAKGLCDRIGIDGSKIAYTPAGGKKETKEIGKIVANDSTTVTETETETETQSETQTETTTIPQVDDTTPNNNAKPVIIGAIFFVVGIAVGIGVTLLIFKRKAKEEE